MKQSLIKYTAIILAVLAMGVVFLLLMSGVSVSVLDSLNSKYSAMYREGERGVSSPWYRDGYHIVDESFIDELSALKAPGRSIISLGSSLSVISFMRSAAKSPEGYDYRFLVCGNGCYKSDRQLYELYKVAAGGEKDDVIKLEVSYSTFRDMDTTITQTVVDKWGAYEIDSLGTVHEKTPLLLPVYELNKSLIKIQNLFELEEDLREQWYKGLRGDGDGKLIPGNFRNNYFNYETVAASCHMDEAMQAELLSLVEEISAEHRLIVELSPLPPSLAATDYGRRFTAYVEGELVPQLEDREIDVLDYRDDYGDGDFCDGVHLGYEGAAAYTEKLSADMDRLLAKPADAAT